MSFRDLCGLFYHNGNYSQSKYSLGYKIIQFIYIEYVSILIVKKPEISKQQIRITAQNSTIFTWYHSL